MEVKLPKFEVVKTNGVNLRSMSSLPSWGVMALRAREARIRPDARGAVCFTIDTEAEFTHPWMIPYFDPYYSASMTGEDSMGLGHHGLHVADHWRQIMEAAGFTNFRAGAVKGLRDTGSGSQSMIVNAVDFAANVKLKPEHEGWVRVINLSLSANFEMPMLREALHEFIRAGGFVFAAAGNDGGEVDFPAGHEFVITSSAGHWNPTTNKWTIGGFSSRGASVDLLAPGVGIVAAWEKGDATLNGTSMASPASAAVGTLILANNPHITTQENLEEVMEAYAQDVFAEGEDDESGAGVPIIPNYPVFEMPSPPEPPLDDKKPTPAWVWAILALAIIGIISYLVFKN